MLLPRHLRRVDWRQLCFALWTFDPIYTYRLVRLSCWLTLQTGSKQARVCVCVCSITIWQSNCAYICNSSVYEINVLTINPLLPYTTIALHTHHIHTNYSICLPMWSWRQLHASPMLLSDVHDTGRHIHLSACELHVRTCAHVHYLADLAATVDTHRVLMEPMHTQTKLYTPGTI